MAVFLVVASVMTSVAIAGTVAACIRSFKRGEWAAAVTVLPMAIIAAVWTLAAWMSLACIALA